MAETAVIPAAETSTEQADAFSAEREAQFMEIAAEIEGGEPEVAAEVATDAAPAADVASAEKETPIEQADGAEPDPLADAKPFTYTVERDARPFEGIQVLADKDGTLQGAIVEPAAIAKLQDRLQRADFLEAQDKQRWDEVKQYREITFKGSDGVEHKGLAAVEQYATENA